jgi:segregation and condensation protein A
MKEIEKEGESGEFGSLGEGKTIEQVSQDQIHGLLFEEKLSWQAIIYDLIKSEQLGILANKFLIKVSQLEEANFFVSSQVLLAASLLLRLKSEILLNQYIPSLDAILFGEKKEKKKETQNMIDFDEEVPGLVLRTPLPRFKKVSLEELMNALGHAIKTENRRIRKVIIAKQQEMETALSLPKHRINIKDRIKEVYSKLRVIFSKQEEKIAFSEFSGKSMEDRIATFIPLLHLDNQHKVWLEQNGHFEEIWILLKHLYEKQNAETLESMKKEAETAVDNLTKEEQERVDELEGDFKNPLGEMINEGMHETREDEDSGIELEGEKERE